MLCRGQLRLYQKPNAVRIQQEVLPLNFGCH